MPARNQGRIVILGILGGHPAHGDRPVIVIADIQYMSGDRIDLDLEQATVGAEYVELIDQSTIFKLSRIRSTDRISPPITAARTAPASGPSPVCAVGKGNRPPPHPALLLRAC